MTDPHSSRTPLDEPSQSDPQTQPLPQNHTTRTSTCAATRTTTHLLTPSRGLNPRAKYVGAAAIGAVIALILSAMSNEIAQRFTAPDRAQITPVGSALLVRSDSQRSDSSSTRTAEQTSKNKVVMPSAPPLESLSEIALREAAPEDRSRWQARVDEDKAIAQRQLLEDKKRAIERQLEDAALAERRRQEDKSLEDQRANEAKQREDTRAQEDRQISEQRQTQAQITPSLTSTQ